MKKWMISLLLLSSGAWAATTQANNLGNVSAVLDTKTVAQMNAYVPRTTAQTLTCSDCTISRLCVSSGTAAGAWVVAVATGIFTAATYPHCQ